MFPFSRDAVLSQISTAGVCERLLLAWEQKCGRRSSRLHRATGRCRSCWSIDDRDRDGRPALDAHGVWNRCITLAAHNI